VKNLLFLDIDGVLVTTRSHFSQVSNLGGLMTDYDTLAVEFLCNFCETFCYEIVISSTWRHHPNRLLRLLNKSGLINYLYTPQNIRQSFTPELRWTDRNIQTEKEIELNNELAHTIPFSRGLEIFEFLKEVKWDPEDNTLGRSGDKAIILDDDSWDLLYWKDKPNVLFVHTNTQNGITAENMEQMLVFENALKERNNVNISREI
jgi:hypothetical protein